MRRLAAGFVLVSLAAPVSFVGCGGKATVAKAPVAATTALAPANPQAVGKMVQGVQAATDGARDRAIALLRDALGLDRALIDAGWSREALARLSHSVDPAATPALPASHIVSVLGETDCWVPYADGLEVARRWKLPESNIFRYRLGHLGMPVQLARDAAPVERLRQLLIAP